MILVRPDLISQIDKYASKTLGIPVAELMRRAGNAVASAVRKRLPKCSKIAIFVGKGNNGADGYAAASMLKDDYDVTVYDVFRKGQNTDEGKSFLDSFLSVGGCVRSLYGYENLASQMSGYDCFIDAVFGTGFTGEMPYEALEIARFLDSQSDALKIAIDLPLGVNALDGSVKQGAVYHADLTVVLGFVKMGIVSYPAKEYIGKMIYDNIGLQKDAILPFYPIYDHLIDYELATSLIPERIENSSKGTFGKLLAVCGSVDFPGAAHLSLEAALRGGAGYVTFLGTATLCDTLLSRFPEAIYKPMEVCDLTCEGLDAVMDLAAKQTAILLGPGSSKSEGMYRLIERLIRSKGAPLVLDADAINVISEKGEDGRALLRESLRTLILTPHPLELSRLLDIPTEQIQQNRISFAQRFAEEYRSVLVLKGAATVVTDGKRTYINSSGSSALAKAGSGDVLAGFLSSLVASGLSPIEACALAVYFHGLAADVIADEFSELGVTPSDLPKEICRQIAKAKKEARK